MQWPDSYQAARRQFMDLIVNLAQGVTLSPVDVKITLQTRTGQFIYTAQCQFKDLTVLING